MSGNKSHLVPLHFVGNERRYLKDIGSMSIRGLALFVRIKIRSRQFMRRMSA
jgi:hypothetical protein